MALKEGLETNQTHLNAKTSVWVVAVSGTAAAPLGPGTLALLGVAWRVTGGQSAQTHPEYAKKNPHNQCKEKLIKAF
jgi:hypothetical protein